jgi:lipopolysaccharide export system protein LptA
LSRLVRVNSCLAVIGLVVIATQVMGELRTQGSPSRTRTVSAQRPPVGYQIVPAEIQEIPSASESDPIEMTSDQAWSWEDDGRKCLYLGGRCRITQGRIALSANEMVLISEPAPAGIHRLYVYMEGDVVIERPTGREVESFGSIVLSTAVDPSYQPKSRLIAGSMSEREVFKRAIERRTRDRKSVQLVQFTQPIDPAMNYGGGPFAQLTGPAPRHVTINPRVIGQDPVIRGSIVPNTAPPEYAITITRGVNLVVDNVPVNAGGQIIQTRIDLTADRAIIWTDANRLDGLGGGFDIDDKTPFQVYLEGNILIRQGTTEVRAEQAFYDIRERRGLMTKAEVRTFVPEYDAELRVRADSLRQQSENKYHARNAYVTTSEFGQPGYRIEASDIFVDTEPNPLTGQRQVPYITAINSRAYLENIPVLAVPYLSGPADESLVPIREVSVGSNSMYGVSVETLWNMETLLGLDLGRGVDWDLELDGYSDRGPAAGTRLTYDQTATIFNMPSRVFGTTGVRYLNDGGVDNLGLDRRALSFPNANRGAVDWEQRIEFPQGTRLTTELDYVLNNDRNYYEGWDERGFDTGKDKETLANLSHTIDNLTGSIMVRDRLNNIFDQTSWLPKADLTLLGQPILGDLVNWYSHTSVGYGQIKPAEPPSDPDDLFTPLPYFPEAEGLVAMSRHEFTMPLNAGPAKVVPYALAEAAFWGEGMTGESIDRFYGSLGVRASIEFWKAMPQFRSRILGLNGLAHKMVFDVDYSYSKSSRDLSDIAQYNEFDEDAQERFRERLLVNSFGGALPAFADPRSYAVRSGMQRSVTAMAPELVDDLHVVQLGWRHRWQTKVGSPAGPRTKDWMTLDLEMAVFPDADRDNFGETLGLLSGRYAWHVGERTSILANGVFDPFTGGQRVWNAGVLSQRSTRGSIYVGFRQIEVGTVQSQLVVGSLSYRMSDKWVSTIGASYDVAEGIDRGQSLTMTRIGEYLLFHLGVGYDRSRDNVGIGISVEPKFGSFSAGSTQLSSLLGIQGY